MASRFDATLILMSRFALAVLLAYPLLCAAQTNAPLHQIFKDYIETLYRENPEVATQRGRNEYNDRWTDWSREAIERRATATKTFLERVRPFLGSSLSEQDSISARLLQYGLERQLQTEPLNVYLLRISPLFGLHSQIYLTVDAMPRNTAADYENILKRLNAVPAYVDQNIAVLTESIERGLIQPPTVVERVIAQLQSQSAQQAAQSELLAAFRKFPSTISESERTALSKRATETYDSAFLPAWRKLTQFMVKTYAPKARPGIALTSVSGGKDFYAAQVRLMTTTAFTPEQIHEIGKKEVERIEKEMLAIARETGFQGSLAEYEKKLIDSPEQHFRSKEEMLAYCRNAAKVIEPELPRLFKNIPRLLYGIRAIPPDREASTASNAQSPSPDGSRPGWFNLNTYEPEKQIKYDKEALTLHEAVPGHVYQGSVALELTNLPEFRRAGRFSAYGEGWALYAESLGTELGVYRDPSSRFGALDSERFRAVRLVVDTGMHALGWTRAQALDYFGTHAPTESISEIDRYIAWPAQALSYKMGQIKIVELRRRAEKELGPKFDVREFHDVVLRNGVLPLELVEELVTTYISQKQKA